MQRKIVMRRGIILDKRLSEKQAEGRISAGETEELGAEFAGWGEGRIVDRGQRERPSAARLPNKVVR